MLMRNGSITRVFFFSILFPCLVNTGFCQAKLLLNGDFEDINICKEYNAECGVEAWFYLKDVKVQMVSNDPATGGKNSFALFYNWNGYKDFTSLIGTILPCNLQPGKEYHFKGWLSAKLNSQLILTPGICTGENFYVPKRPFVKTMMPERIDQLKHVPETSFYEFEYRFVANGNERYLTFGTFITEDSVSGKKISAGTQTVSLMLDNFSLTAIDSLETLCAAYQSNKQNIYQYDYRHKEMDYTLYGKGKLPVELSGHQEDNQTGIKTIVVPTPTPLKPDTLKLGDVLFDFNKAELKTDAIKMLDAFFMDHEDKRTIDSVYIEGHTDSIGSDKRNMLLSKERSEAIMQWMITNQVTAANRIAIHAFGRSRPVASNKTPAGRALNRRVEIIVFRGQTK